MERHWRSPKRREGERVAGFPVESARDEQARSRDEVARNRDRLAAERDRAAGVAQDRQLEEIGYQLWGPAPRVSDAVEALAGLRTKAAAQRAAAAADRERASLDREAAAAERARLLAELDRAREALATSRSTADRG